MSGPVQHEHEAPRRRWYVPMVSRAVDEEHRASTPLELFFDLCFVVAVAIASAELHHSLVEGHVGEAVRSFALVFFSIWWAWMNFTWFASAYDTDDAVYRITTFVQMAGVLVLAAGIPRAFDSSDIGLITAGYVVMRLALVTQWLRAARSDVDTRPCTLRYAIGVSVMQILWVIRLAVPEEWAVPSIIVLALGELSVPVFAEQAARTTWHPHHIAERYGLFTIIVLGESILAATTAFQQAFDAGGHLASLITLSISALVVVFSMWWLYFDQAEHPAPGSFGAAFRWGYGHLFVFASAAAVGAAIALIVDQKTIHTEVSNSVAGLAMAASVAIYLLAVWLIHVLPNRNGVLVIAFPVCAVLVLASAALGLWAVVANAVLLVGLVALALLQQREPLDSVSSP